MKSNHALVFALSCLAALMFSFAGCSSGGGGTGGGSATGGGSSSGGGHATGGGASTGTGGGSSTGGGSATGGGSSTGGGGASTGGGTGTGGGSSNCTNGGNILTSDMQTFGGNALPPNDAGYTDVNAFVAGPGTTLDLDAGTFINLNYVDVQLYYQSFPSTPFTRTIAGADAAFNTCSNCLLYHEGCVSDSMGNLTCQRAYFSEVGTLQVNTLIYGQASGNEFAGTVMNPKFQEWNFTSDSPVPGGKCITFGEIDFDATGF